MDNINVVVSELVTNIDITQQPTVINFDVNAPSAPLDVYFTAEIDNMLWNTDYVAVFENTYLS